jgi:hypothetical protein
MEIIEITTIDNKKQYEDIVKAFSKDTWEGIKHHANTKTGLPADRLVIKEDIKTMTSITSPTNIGLYITSLVAARDLGFISETELLESLEKVFRTLENMDTIKGLYFNWYNTDTGKPDTRFNNFISTVDNAWLIASLMVIRSAVPAFKDRVNSLFNNINISLLYNYDRELFYGGYNVKTSKPTRWYYNILNTEARIASYIGINEFGIGWNHFGRLKRSSSTNQSKENQLLFRSWNGSMFEALMPTLFMPEPELSSTWKQNHYQYINEQINYGVANNDGFWGYSPSEDPKGKYREFGVPNLATKAYKQKVDHIVSPYAVFLTLPFVPDQSITNLLRLKSTYPEIYKPGFGFTDSINIKSGAVSKTFLSLDQEMSFLAQFNYLSNNQLYKYFGSQLKSSVENILKVMDYEISLGLYS